MITIQLEIFRLTSNLASNLNISFERNFKQRLFIHSSESGEDVLTLNRDYGYEYYIYQLKNFNPTLYQNLSISHVTSFK